MTQYHILFQPHLSQPTHLFSHLAKACEVEWELNKNTAVPPPQSPVACVENGTVDHVRLVPFSVAKLRLEEIPVMEIWNEVSLCWCDTCIWRKERRNWDILSSRLYIFDTLDTELVGRHQRIASLWHFKWTRLKILYDNDYKDDHNKLAILLFLKYEWIRINLQVLMKVHESL